MSRKKQPAQFIRMLREAGVALPQGETVGQVCRRIGVSELSYYRWRKEYGGLKVGQGKRLKELERENTRRSRRDRLFRACPGQACHPINI